MLVGASPAVADSFYAQAWVGGVNSGFLTNQVATANLSENGGPVLVTTGFGYLGQQQGYAQAQPGSLMAWAFAQGGYMNSLSGRADLWETFIVHGPNPNQWMDVDLNVVLDGTESGLSGAYGGRPRANGGVGLTASLPWNQGTLSTGHSFFGVSSLTVGDSLSRSFSVLEGIPFQILLELNLAVDTSGAFGEDIGITADFSHTGRMFLSSRDPNVTITSASGYDYAPATASTVPEPLTVVLLGGGLAGAVVRRRRR